RCTSRARFRPAGARATPNNPVMAVRRLKQAFGVVIRECRKKSGMSQEKLGFEAGLTRNFISLVELGQRSPTLDTIAALAQALGISASALIARAERKQR